MSKKVKSDKTKPEDKTKLESTTKPEDNIKLEDVFIANPLYDPVFKYLMSDNISARKLLSAIIGKEVIELSFAPQEHVENVDVQEQSYIICRLDFTALIRTESGSLAVMIEVQKVHYHNDIIRFRRYLGGQYQNKDYVYDDSEGRRHVRQIYCIFFIGDGVGIKNAPVIEINPIAKDVTTEKNLQVQNNEFVLSLHHRSWIVQVPELKKYRRNDLERLLGIFDQTNTIENRHILNIKSEKFPKEYHPIIRRLQMAAKNEKVRNAMQAEDDILEHFKIEERMTQIKLEKKDKIIAEQEVAIVHEREEKEAAIAREHEKEVALVRERVEKEIAIAREREEKEAAIARERAEKEAAIAHERAEKEAALARERAEKEAALAREREEKEAALAREKQKQKETIVRNSIRANVPLDTIRLITGLSEEEIQAIMNDEL